MNSLYRAYLKKLIILSVDLFAVLMTLPIALFIRLDFPSFLNMVKKLSLNHFLTVTFCYFSAFLIFRTYRTIVRLSNLFTAVRVALACFVGASLSYILVFHIFGFDPLPRSIYLIQLLLLTPILTGFRFSWRLFARIVRPQGTGLVTLIYGAGAATDRFLPVMIRMTEEMRIVGVVDDDLAKKGSEVQGVRVRGTSKDLPQLVDKLGVQQVILCMPSVKGADLRKIVDMLYALDLKVRVLPAAESYVKTADALQISDIRDLNIEDLLRRAPRSINRLQIEQMICGRVVLVTGGGGSIGSELVRQIATMNPKKIIINDASEYALYKISEEISENYKDINLFSHLGDLSNLKVACQLFSGQSIDFVFHACAYKHVPLVENNVCAAVLNNIQSAKNVFEQAALHGCERVILISSDKAVRPTNVMGATKRVCELMSLWFAIHQKKPQKCSFSAVRFGNVLGSSGSVIPKFIEQIKAGGPVTITHPEITRFFMLIPEAVSLVLQATTASKSGEIFVLNMGEPIRIAEMARQVIRMMGKAPEIDIPIVYTGLRPGEKLFEELQLPNEEAESVTDDFFKLVGGLKPAPLLMKQIESLLEAASSGLENSVRDSLFELVSTYEVCHKTIKENDILQRIKAPRITMQMDSP